MKMRKSTPATILVSSLVLLIGVLFYQCENPKENEPDIYEGLDMRTKTRLRQYMVQGKGLYQLHCQNCHGESGEGLGKLIPPLAKADYLMENIPRAICVTKNGVKGEIVVNGIKYNQEMPANNQLRDLEIAEIITYITNTWGNKAGLMEVKTVEKIRKECP